jgi:hypothetical protein
VNLSVLGADDGGEAGLTYTWAATGTPPAPVSFSANGTNAAKNTTATFTRAGVYTLQATIRDSGGLTVTSSVSVTVAQGLTSVGVSPASATVSPSASAQFTATALDQFGIAMTTQPSVTWSLSGGGTISSGGLFSAGTASGGPFTVTASSGGKSGTASVTVSALFAAKINFEPVGTTPAGYQPDSGDIYAGRGNGLTYGWNISHTDVVRTRGMNPDPRLDTLCHFHAGGKWEIAVPNGKYNVFVSVGDPSAGSPQTINVEGVNYWTALALNSNQFAQQTKTVTVSDGKLTIDQGAAPDKSTRINYVEITQVGN